MRIETTRELAQAFKQGKYSGYGCYPLYFITSDGEALSHDAVRANYRAIVQSIRERLDDGWRVIAHEINWEDGALFCADTGERITSAYSEPLCCVEPRGD